MNKLYRLGDICKSLSKGTLKTTELVKNGKYPVMNSGKGIYGFYDKFNNVGDTIVVASRGAGFVSYMDKEFWAGGLCYPYTSINKDKFLTKFIFYSLKKSEYEIMTKLVFRGAIPALNKQDLDNFQILIPSIEEQHKIVNILDRFSVATNELTSLLQKELEFRKKQYTYYRDELLTFSDVPVYKLGDVIISLRTGLNPRKFFKLNTPEAKNFYITIREMHNGRITTTNKTDKINDEALILCNKRSNLEIGDVLFSGTGTIGEVVVIEEFPTNWNIKEGIYSLKPKKEIINSKFLKYILTSTAIHDSIMYNTDIGTVRSISMEKLKRIQIPIPSIETQTKIVNILDKFSTSYQNIILQLNSELQLRKKQYQFYLDKLLTFEIGMSHE